MRNFVFTLKEAHILKVLENGVMSVLELEREEVTRGWRKVPNEFFTICFQTNQYTVLGSRNQGGSYECIDTFRKDDRSLQGGQENLKESGHL
jgi:hypothetical protein